MSESKTCCRVINVWNVADAADGMADEVATINVLKHDSVPPSFVTFNPTMMMMAAAGRSVLFLSTEGDR